MVYHRVRLSDRDLQRIVSALRHSAGSNLSPITKQELRFLADRLAECHAGNPHLILGIKPAFKLV